MISNTIVRFLAVLALTLGFGSAWAQAPEVGQGVNIGEPVNYFSTSQPNTFSALQTFNAGANGTFFNATGPNPLQVLGTPVLNLLSNQTSPILSPETGNAPNSAANYFPAAPVMGWSVAATSSSAATYNSMITVNLSLVGTAPNHFGLEEHSIAVTGSGTITGELNVQKNYLSTVFGSTITNGESFEAGMDLAGAASNWSGYTSGLSISPTGTVAARVTVFDAGMTNNSGVGVFYVADHCPIPNGTPPSNDFCVLDEDPNGTIATKGGVDIGDTGHPAAGTLSIGKAGSLVGSISLFNTTSGSITIKPTTGALGSAVLTLPDVTDTLAVLGTQTFTGVETFSGTVNVTGALQSGGVAGVTKSCVTSAATLTISNGIITGTSGTGCT